LGFPRHELDPAVEINIDWSGIPGLPQGEAGSRRATDGRLKRVISLVRAGLPLISARAGLQTAHVI